MKDLANRRALVVGLGRSGVAAARFLAARGAAVTVTDAKPAVAAADTLRGLGVQLALGGHDPGLFGAQDLIVVSPGVPWDLEPLVEARRRGIEVVGEVELAAWFLPGRIIGVTGANGKTTTTVLIGHLLRESGVPVQVGGNVGLPYPPAIDLVESSTTGTWNVLELSSFQLEAIRTFHAHIGVVLNITPDHLDRHGTFEAYAAAKERLFLNQQTDDYAVLNADDAICAGYGERVRSQVVWFSRTRELDNGASVRAGEIVMRRGRETAPLAQVDQIPIRGPHNLENTLAATTAAWLAGAPAEAIRRALPTFKAVEHRLEFVRQVAGVSYYNDSKATNVDATLKALEAFAGGLWVILGGKDKGSDYSVLRDLVRTKARAVILIGAAAEKIAGQLDGAAPLIEAGTIDRAVKLAADRARPGETVLLAPACASFDQFENYEHRGRVFKELVGRI
jgi:UDP-N-acetylmuramoylalanine--D-glutamate ligase